MTALIGNLPRPVTSFVGREDELLALVAEIERTPLVTLTGVGGVGKTRLAVEAATQARSGFRDGAWLCELALVRELDAAATVILEAVGGKPRAGASADEVLLQLLSGKHLLLVLDNCEHLLGTVAPLASKILQRCPEVRVLATSREGLGTAGERIVAVGTLQVPGAHDDATEIAAVDAVRLFAERAQAVRSGFEVDDSNAVAVAEICRRLDGVPLAIELAAARIPLLTPAELAQRLDQRFRLLTGSERGAVERHHTLRAAIDWSYELLDDTERGVLDRLSVFVGGFSLEAAEAVAADGAVDREDVLDRLGTLVARSLVQVAHERGVSRYRLLETIRQFAYERLEQDGAAVATRNAHASYFVTAIEQLAANPTGDTSAWIERANREVDNVRAALVWAIDQGDADTVLRFYELAPRPIDMTELITPLLTSAPRAARIAAIEGDPRYPLVLAAAAHRAAHSGVLEEMRRQLAELDAAEARLGTGPSPYTEFVRTQVASAEGRIDLWVEHGERGVALARETADDRQLALQLGNLAIGRYLLHVDVDRAVDEVEEALAIASRLPEASLLPLLRGYAAFVLADSHPDRAATFMRDAAGQARVWGLSVPITAMLGDVAERLGDRRLALETYVAGMDELEWLGWPEILGRMHRRIALLLIDVDPEASAILLGAGLARSRGARLTGRSIDAQDRGISELAATLGTDRSSVLQAQGASMADHDVGVLAHRAVARALADLTDPSDLPPGEATAGNVFRREGDVWVLAYEGRSIRLRDAKGLQYLGRLLARPGLELHVADLAADESPGRGLPRSQGGEVLDDAAKRQYQRRLADLAAERDEAKAWNDQERLARVESEIDALTQQLTSAYGLGGRPRSMADPTERARKAVTNRIRETLRRVAAEHESLGRHLGNAVHTGTFCSYDPSDRPGGRPERPTGVGFVASLRGRARGSWHRHAVPSALSGEAPPRRHQEVPMPSTTLSGSEPTPQLSDREHDLGGEAQPALEWLARTARWQRRMDQLRAGTA